MTKSVILPLLRYAALLLAAVSTVALAYGVAVDDPQIIFGSLVQICLGLITSRVCWSLIETDVNVFNPTIVFIYFFAFFHVIEPTFQYFIYGLPSIRADYFIRPVWVTLAGIVAFEAAMSLYRPKPLKLTKSMHLDRNMLLIMPVLPMVLSLLGFLGLFGGAQLGYLMVIAAMVIWQRIPGNGTRLYVACIVLLAIGISLSEFTRAFVAQVLLIVLLYVHFLHKRLPLWGAVAMGIAIFPVMVLGAIYRSIHKIPGLKDAEDLPIAFLEFAFDTALQTISSVSGFYYATIQMDFPVSYEGYANIVNYVPRYVDYLYGLTYYRVLFFLIPRSLWPEKPENITSEYVFQFIHPNPGEYSVAPLLLGELYWNLGFFGVMFGMFMIGIFIRFLHNNMDAIVHNSLTFALFATFLLVIPQVMRGGSTTILLYAMIYKFVPIVIMFFLLNAAPRLYWQFVYFLRRQVAYVTGRLGNG